MTDMITKYGKDEVQVAWKIQIFAVAELIYMDSKCPIHTLHRRNAVCYARTLFKDRLDKLKEGPWSHV